MFDLVGGRHRGAAVTDAAVHIYHVCSRTVATAALEAGEYRAPSLATEGFIHLSQAHQVRGVIARYYTGQTDLVVLVVEPARLRAPLRFEPPSSLPRRTGTAAPDRSELFPHLYGALNADAVVDMLQAEALPAMFGP